MAKIPAKTEARMKDALKKFRGIVEQAKARDAGEADTSTLVKDILSDLFGYDKYSEITAEHQIKGTYCDLAIKIEGKLTLLLEVKPVGAELKENFVKQAVDYAANQGIEWVVLTNACRWQIYKIGFSKPITNDLLVEIDLIGSDAKSNDDLDALFLLCREAHGKSLLDEYHQQKQALSKHCIGALLMTDSVVAVIRRELRRLSPDVKISPEEIIDVLANEVIKRDVIEGDKATEASKKILRVANRQLREKASSEMEIPAQKVETSATTT